MKAIPFLFFYFILYSSFGQVINKNYVSKKLTSSKDTIALENVAISPVNFIVKDDSGEIIPPSQYDINYQKGTFYFNPTSPQEIEINYFNYPSFLTQTYSPFDKSIIIPKATPASQTYSLKKSYTKDDFFGGLNTYGNITRGISVGNNQGSVLNSGLDLQITGNLSENLKLRASIKDSNLPIQENGVSQNINEFDRVFIEMFTDRWNIKAGDVDLENHDSYFLNFTKKINGAKLDVTLDDGEQKTFITASGALVKGKFTTQNVSNQEGNQGPYQLTGTNGELNVVVISGSETVYVNGMALKRGEQHDYTIDYNTAEITFNPTFPINATQRIIVDFQYNDQNYNRFVTHDGVTYQNEKFTIGTYFYNENDVKNQPIQQNLSDEQKLRLQQAGNDPTKMLANSAVQASYDENRIQYKKNNLGSFIYTTDKNEILYNVQFRFVGANKGNYIEHQTSAIGKIFKYAGVNAGNYSPEVQIFAPTKTQMAVVKTGYQINEKSFINTEVAYSNNDQNLFSTIDDNQNKGIATTLTWQQQISNGAWKTNNLFDVDFVQKNFNNIERLYNVEFNRDWNLDLNTNPNSSGNQVYLRNTLTTSKEEKQIFSLQTNYLNIGENFKGYKTNLNTQNRLGKLNATTKTSYLKSTNITDDGAFVQHNSSLKYSLQKTWFTGLLSYENNDQKNKKTDALNLNNQKYLMLGGLIGIGDSTKVYSTLGYNITKIDSIRSNQLTRVQNAQNFSIENQLIKTAQTSLSTFANYRKVKHFYAKDIDVVNGRIQYTQQFFKNLVRWATVYETSSGSTPQQNFSYIEVEPGQGYYTYLGDLNGNNIKDFDEFEIAQFTDQANYLRVVLPNIKNQSTQKAKLSQSVFINFIQFKNKTSKWLSTLSHFSNQSSILVDKDQLKKGNKFNINPFEVDQKDVVGLQQNMRTSFFFNRGLQNYSTTYTFLNNKNTQNIASNAQTATQKLHEINFQHNILSSWLLASTAKSGNNKSTSDTSTNRNFDIISKEVNPSISFLKDEFSTIETNYTFKDEFNDIGLETLESHNFGLAYNYNNPKKGSVIANINLIENKYQGPVNTPASYRILEGLQPNRNYTWSFIIQRKLTDLLDLSLTYNGRKNTSSNTIHTGSVQLRANF